ncbi:MAG: glycoside hydrolase family 32 protein [Bacteroidota bacterium]
MRYLVIILVLFSCTAKNEKADYRPKFHFTPQKNWTNDPNGLVYYDGEYHLFFQYNPYGDKWGHMSWGHAVSKDLLHWEELPVAIEEYVDSEGDSVMIFSGSAVVSGDSIVAIFTSHKSTKQSQSIAVSHDKARTFKVYKGNPVLDIGRKDFRDPKVFWYEPQKKWVMAAVVPDQHKVNLYESKDLKSWNFMSDFGKVGDTTKIWECPDLFPLSNKWVLLISASHPQGGPFVGMQYFVGDFDGTKFSVDDSSRYPLYVDYGKDFYAGITYNNEPGGRRIMIGWANNWAYAGSVPTSPWRGGMSLPRELSLDSDLKLKQVPAVEIESKKVVFDKTDSIEVSGTWIGYNAITKNVFLNRMNKMFPSIEKAPARLIDGKVKLEIFEDHSIIEVFINDGEAVISDQVFPKY